MIGVIIDVDPDYNSRLKYYIFVQGITRILWYTESEIVGHVI